MAVKADTQALITFKDIGKNNFGQGEGVIYYLPLSIFDIKPRARKAPFLSSSASLVAV